MGTALKAPGSPGKKGSARKKTPKSSERSEGDEERFEPKELELEPKGMPNSEVMAISAYDKKLHKWWDTVTAEMNARGEGPRLTYETWIDLLKKEKWVGNFEISQRLAQARPQGGGSAPARARA